MRNNIECEPSPEHKLPKPPNSRRQSVVLNMSVRGLGNYVRRNLAHTKTASASIIALDPKSIPPVESAPTGEASCLKEASDFFAVGPLPLVLGQGPGVSSESHLQLGHPQLHT